MATKSRYEEKLGMSPSKAAAALGCSVACVQRHMSENPEMSLNELRASLKYPGGKNAGFCKTRFGMTNKEAAEFVGCSVSSLRRLAHANPDISLDDLKKAYSGGDKTGHVCATPAAGDKTKIGKTPVFEVLGLSLDEVCKQIGTTAYYVREVMKLESPGTLEELREKVEAFKARPRKKYKKNAAQARERIEAKKTFTENCVYEASREKGACTQLLYKGNGKFMDLRTRATVYAQIRTIRQPSSQCAIANDYDAFFSTGFIRRIKG